MRVYIEFVIIDNLIIDGIIVWLVNRTARCGAKKYLMLLSAAVGTAGAVLMPLPDISLWLSLCLKILLSLAMTVLISGVRPKKFFTALALFYVYTFVLGGSVLGMAYLCGGFTVLGGSVVYAFPVPLGLIAGGVFAAVALCCWLIVFVHKRRRLAGISCEADITVGDHTARVRGILDTGNLLTDPATGYPVAVAAASVMFELIADEDGLFDSSGLPDARYIDYNTAAGGGNRILLFRPDRFLLYYADKVHIISDIMVGICGASVFSDGCRMLMPYIV